MDRKLIWTERASSDIEAIVRYIARRNPSAASKIGFGIYDRAQILIQNPDAGTILDKCRDGGWHKLIYRRWKIIYTRRWLRPQWATHNCSTPIPCPMSLRRRTSSSSLTRRCFRSALVFAGQREGGRPCQEIWDRLKPELRTFSRFHGRYSNSSWGSSGSLGGASSSGPGNVMVFPKQRAIRWTVCGAKPSKWLFAYTKARAI